MAFVSSAPIQAWTSSHCGKSDLINTFRNPVRTNRRSRVTATLESVEPTNNYTKPLNIDDPFQLFTTSTPHDEDYEESLFDNTQGWVYAILGMFIATTNPATTIAQEVSPALKEIFKSKPASLMHPGTMWVIFGTGIYTFWLGYQASLVRKVEPAKRKELVKARVAKRHFRTSSTLFATMTCFTFIGMANTYTRTGKLFPGPHLYNGLGLVALMSIMASLVPAMQDGKLWARNTHFTLAFGAIGLLGWQAKSGVDIVSKLLGWT
eukprot:Plantae.Rhodophyta-Hildenbrandia_rubra.ctg15136.p1 GENE.Plantae.Rhodophyta-Hildenbrandia_rubra.ctg15136~~Plantae.Rhodophyta-Hildenbrandia_rubra.ctg15136.p1  ORF type:complete len:264 (-),score=26.03 Plantae.Rhodophyta-Hildenbrandia_rubra.ctg15136:954-1745(-)